MGAKILHAMLARLGPRLWVNRAFDLLLCHFGVILTEPAGPQCRLHYGISRQTSYRYWRRCDRQLKQSGGSLVPFPLALPAAGMLLMRTEQYLSLRKDCW